MKHCLVFVLMCLASSLWTRSLAALPEVVELDSCWSFSRVGGDEWLPAVVPGTVHQDLLRHGLLPDPFYGTNEKKIQWVENEDWAYRMNFTLGEEQMGRQAARLVFQGLDTYADVYLNGALVLSSDNMFRGYAVDVKGLLRPGENRLYVVFHSAVKKTLPQWETNGFEYPADNDHAEKRVSVFNRKAPYSFGWDWGIRMATCGIWRPVTLEFYDGVRIDDYFVKQESLDDKEARISNRVEIYNVTEESLAAEVEINCSLRGIEVGKVKKTVTLRPGHNEVEIPFTVENPERWMPNGWGKAVLYDFSSKVSCGNQDVASRRHRIGLRTVRVVTEKDSIGESFYFEVNGIPMFAKGANFIPSDILLPSMTDERYETLFRNVKEANMNMLRIWGGGTYEDNRFYDLADENGILIWQDFIFACSPYPADPTFLRRVSEEADYNIRRLRNHACLAMWCGNNEILEGMNYWGWNRRYPAEIYQKFQDDYQKLFCELLPAKVAELDEGRFYQHTSPYVAQWTRPDTWKIRDTHNWGIWFGRKPFESTDNEWNRFVSEFGFQAFPEMKTIRMFASPEDYAIDSEVMTAHQKSSVGNDLIKTSMERYFKVPEKFEDFVYVNLVLQGQGMRQVIETHRRQRPYCMGSLYWQLNDDWPVVSWSGIDYYGNWKALHYQVKRAFAPVIISCLSRNDSLQVNVVSDRLDCLEHLSLDMQLLDFSGKRLKHAGLEFDLPGNSSQMVYSDAVGRWAMGEERKNTCLLLTLKDRKGEEIARKVFYFAQTKDLSLPETDIHRKIKLGKGRMEVTLSSPVLAKDVFIEIPIHGARFSDNFFDLLPGEKRKVIIESPLIRGEENITVKHIRETY